MSQFDASIFCLFDTLPSRDIKKWLELHTNIADYTSEHYSFFAHQRSKLYEQLKNALLIHTKPQEIHNWRRIVDHQFSDTPLSALGSIKHFPGGRFNIGDIDPLRFPQFAGLYLAEDTSTALRESLSLDPDKKNNGLTSIELNVAGNFSHFVVDEALTTVLDLTDFESLRDFFNIIKQITLPEYYIKRAARIKIPPMRPIRNLKELRETLFRENWRLMPMQLDVPANSQVLGQIAHAAGIEGILFPSVKTNKKNLVIYPENFKDSEAHIEINGRISKSVKHTRMDKNTYKDFI